MNDLKNTYTSVFLKAANKSADSLSIDKVRGLWWFNLRSKGEGGLRLTDQGIEFVKTQADIKTYDVKLPRELKVTPQILVWLDHFITSPWYISKGTLTVLSEKSAFELYLFSGDIKKLGYAKAMSKRLAES